jgi:hypothetical protein
MKDKLTKLEQELLLCFRNLQNDRVQMIVVQQIKAIAELDFSPQIMDFRVTENRDSNERYIRLRDEIQADLDAYEEKRFRSFARRRIKEGKIDSISEFDFKYLPLKKRVNLLIEFNAMD